MPGSALLALLAGLALPAPAEGGTLRLATTTSTEASGLLAELLPAFEARTGIRVHVIAVGTGKALRLGQAGDVDVVLVHARAAEDAFMAAGHGSERRDVMWNDFLLVGPGADGAGIRGAPDVLEALRRIARARARFVSRGDDSGTHKRELALWKEAGVSPSPPWYLESGQGMGRVLQMAAELRAYTLTDRGTWLAYQGRLEPLAALFEGDARLHNPYGVIAVNPARHPGIDAAAARAFVEWITSPEAQERIGAFRVRGRQLFHPAAEPGRQERRPG